MLPNKNRQALAQYRMATAKACCDTARHNADFGDFRSSANRSYYAIFHGVRAVLALDGLDFKKHSAVLGKFRELYIKTNMFDVKYSEMIGKAFVVRNDSDYEDFYIVSREDALQQIENAAEFLEAVQAYLAMQFESS